MRREEFKMERTRLEMFCRSQRENFRVPIIIHLGKHMQCLLTMR